MKTADLFREKTVFSFEVFPPKKTIPLESIFLTLGELQELTPDFISVTYSASGNANKEATVAIASKLKNQLKVESVAHLTSIQQSKDDVLVLLKELKENNVENILALLGDPVEGSEPKHDFKQASDLVSFIRQHADFNVIAACYPEGHPKAPDLDTDIRHLKTKVDSGASQLITQLFYDNDLFYTFREKTAKVGINVPIQAGIMPIMSRGQIERIASMGRVTLPPKLLKMIDHYGDHPVAMRDAGIAFAIEQIVDLLAHGVDGIHLYTMNNTYIARRINEAVRSLIRTGSY
ncbi:MAG: methylenetetrahydrofolate reductase [NAD(P)H] [Eubacteriales bacterium]|nr:methylenetetrahydrofolate reductase [NAD(P)H] [Eubacteriales bacterium]